MVDIREQIERLRRLDGNSVQATLGSRIFGEAADTMEKMLAVVEAARMVHSMDDVIPDDCAVCDALAALNSDE